ncbi:hypothetical protein TNCV_1044501 [Trichonephila clavipes]|nr:hypothetical protein TNCV_1044501 [Trichonephila clavipes]
MRKKDFHGALQKELLFVYAAPSLQNRVYFESFKSFCTGACLAEQNDFKGRHLHRCLIGYPNDCAEVRENANCDGY